MDRYQKEVIQVSTLKSEIKVQYIFMVIVLSGKGVAFTKDNYKTTIYHL